VGGAHLQTLARMGVGSFHLADPDHFEVANFNRQLGASMQTLGCNKADIMASELRAINPHATAQAFTDGIHEDNLAEFLDGVDVVVDGIEFFRIEVREMLYKGCRERGIPVVNAGPIGYGAAVLVFEPDGLSFEEYFGMDPNYTRAEKLIAMALGLGPGARGDMDPSAVQFDAEKGPALASACMLCAAAAATEVLKLLTGRGRIASAHRGIYYDILRNRTLRLKRSPALRTSITGRLTRWLVFKQFPALKRMHEEELASHRESMQSSAPLPVAHLQ
jgi:molybdopterin/thiamine biosynthesis adenylyltransferase